MIKWVGSKILVKGGTKQMAQFETREVLTMLGNAAKRPQNKIVLKLVVLILTSREWENKEKKKMYTYTSFSSTHDGIISFNTSRLLPKGKEAEVLLTMTGFQAYEALR